MGAKLILLAERVAGRLANELPRVREVEWVGSEYWVFGGWSVSLDAL
jgi:hypothetical protein